MAKNLPFWSACVKIPFRFFLDATAAYKGLLSGNFNYWLAIAKAHLGFVYWLLFVKRTTPVPINPSKHFSGWYNGCLIWEYFIKKRRTFKEIVRYK
jgi:hypothetical protein